MPLTRIKNTAIGDDGVTTQKLDDTTGGFTLPGIQFVKVPVGTTAQQLSTQFRWTFTFQYYFGCFRTV